MKPKHVRFVSQIILIIFASFQLIPLAGAKKVELFDPHKASVAIIPYPASERDRPFIDKTAEAIRQKLSHIPYFHVVDPQKVADLVGYHADYVNKESVLTDAEKYLGLAKTHWFDRQYKEAEATVNAAIESLRRQKNKGDLLVDALLTKAIVLKELKQHQDSEAVFQEALKVNPSLTMEGLPISGRTRTIFNETRRKVLERLSGNLEIKTDPPAAAVYLNGIKKGVTPLTLKQLPEGSYLLTLEGSHYQTINEPVVVTASTTQFINRKLQWVSGRGGRDDKELGVPVKSDTILQKEIKLASSIGETLKVDKVILVSSERRGNEAMLVVRTIDTAFKAAYNPLAMPFDEFLNDEEDSIASISDDLDKKARLHVLNNPQEYLEPDTGDVRVLRRKRPFYKTPVFYTLVGLVVGGTAGTIAGILLTNDNDGGDDDGGGGVEIGFE